MNRQIVLAFFAVVVAPAFAQDTTPPVLTSFTFSPMAVNTTTSPAKVTVTEQATDNLSGVGIVVAAFTSPSGKQSTNCQSDLISGTNLDGTWQCQITLPAYAEGGAWTVSFVLTDDNVGNYVYYYTDQLQALGFPTTLLVTSNQDTTPPVLTGFTFSPMAVNTTISPAKVTVTEQATDNLSGVGIVVAAFTSPTGKQSTNCQSDLISGTNLDGTWQCQITLPAYAEGGDWSVSFVLTGDNVGNYVYYYTDQLQALGFPTTLLVTSNQDTTPPVLTGFSFSPTAVNTTTSPAKVTVTEQATDNLSGVGIVVAAFTSPTGKQSTNCQSDLISGTNLDGTWQCQITLPAYAEGGAWTVSFVLTGDNVGNYVYYYTDQLQALGFPTTLQVDPPQETQTITFGALPHQALGTPPFTLTATASSGLAVTFASTTSSTCTVSGATVTLVSVGTCTIQATQSGNVTYSAATPVSQSFQIRRGSQTITFGALRNRPLGSRPFRVSASASSGLPVILRSRTLDTCTIAGTTVTLVAVGNCTIRARQRGNANWHAAAYVDQSFRVTPAR